MKLTLTFFILLTSSTVYSQDKCPAMIYWKYLGPVHIYDKPDGRIIAQMENDSINEEFLHLEIVGQTDSYFLAEIASLTKKQKGWIRKAEYIKAFIKHEEYPMDLELTTDKQVPTDKIVISNWAPGLLTIEKYADKWAFVSTKQNGQTYKGWIEITKLCANAYTTCN